MQDDAANSTQLSERDRQMLDFEGTWWKYAGLKEDEIRSRFDLTPTRYYQVLNALIDRADAIAYAPMTVKRLRRLRDDRQRRRAGAG